MDLYCDSLEHQCYYSDEKYSTLCEISNIQDFKKLFCFEYISAARPVDDSLETNKHLLSEALINLAKTSDVWKREISKLPYIVMTTLEETNIHNTIQETSSTVLNDTINSINKSNGGHTGKIELNLEIKEQNIEHLLQSTIFAKYNIKGQQSDKDYYLHETSQGLGYNNLIYIHTQIENYIKKIDPLKVNFLVIEEPESHMHPQMQYVFCSLLLKQYKDNNYQGLITTHSSEIVRGVNIENLRVIREETQFNSIIYNLSTFINETNIPEQCDKENITIIENYKSFFESIGISEIVFADVAILYEGDTERLYLKNYNFARI